MPGQPTYRAQLPHLPDALVAHIAAGGLVEAHNALFEICIWHNVGVMQLGWPVIPLHQWRCSLAKCAHAAMPLALGQAGEAMGLPITKDTEGYKLMMKMCKPRKPTKNDPSTRHDSPEMRERLGQYCDVDVESEHCLSSALPDLPPRELGVWWLDVVTNLRGIPADLAAIRGCIKAAHDYKTRLDNQCFSLTGGALTTTDKAGPLGDFLRTLGVDMPNVQKATVAEWADKPDLPPLAKQLLGIRKEISKKSVSKAVTMLAHADPDDIYLRMGTQYHAAATGRYGGRGFQPHNFARGSDDPVELTRRLNLLKCGGLPLLEAHYGDPMTTLSGSLRAMFHAAPGHEFKVNDYSAIEARVLAWLVNSTKRLEIFRGDGKIYEAAAADIYSVSIADVTTEQRRIGKVAELALGYGGGVGAFQSMATIYGVDIPDEQADQIKVAWRAKNPEVPALWRALEAAAIAAVSTGVPQTVGYVTYHIVGKFLCCRLPSGRDLRYYQPRLRADMAPWGSPCQKLSFMGMKQAPGSTQRTWCRIETWGGTLTENIDQAISRDILTECMPGVEAAGYPIVLHVHDELVTHTPIGFGSVDELGRLMCCHRPWAAGLPLAAAGWSGSVYRKD
jgi:DNA polymerase